MDILNVIKQEIHDMSETFMFDSELTGFNEKTFDEVFEIINDSLEKDILLVLNGNTSGFETPSLMEDNGMNYAFVMTTLKVKIADLQNDYGEEELKELVELNYKL